MSKVFEILVGIPASGKSTLRKEKMMRMSCVHGNKRVFYTNKDEIRESLKKTLNQKNVNESLVLTIETDEIRNAMANGCYYILNDNTNLNTKHWERYRELAREFDYEIEFTLVDDSWDVKLCHSRNMSREKKVPSHVIESMSEQFITAWWKLTTELDDMPNQCFVAKDPQECVIFDIDGTLANHKGIRRPFEWDKVGLDTVHEHVKEMFLYHRSMQRKIIIFSGRDAVCRDETAMWLVKNGMVFDELHMREEGNSEKDVYIKRDLFMKHIAFRKKVLAVFDDRNQVCRLWRGLHLPLFQVGLMNEF